MEYRSSRWSVSTDLTGPTVIHSEFAPLLDVLPVGFKVQTGEVLNKSRCAHATPTETVDNPIQPVTHLTADEHRLAVGYLGYSQVSGTLLVQRQPALLAADTLLWHCHFFGRSA